MKDRVSIYPGRVKLTPVSGQENTYDMVRADNPTQGGDPLNKNTLLKDATAALFGLDATAVPDDVLTFLGHYNQHWWSVLHSRAYSYYEEVLTPRTSTANITQAATTIYYSYSISISDTGVVSLDSPQSIVRSGWESRSSAQELCNQLAELAVDAPYYMYTTKNTTIHKIPKGATAASTFASYGYTFAWAYDSDKDAWLEYGTGTPASIVTSTIVNVPAGETTYVHSTDRNAFPDSGTVDGLTYEYLGIPFDNAVNAVKIATGTYTGTGTYGSSNQNSLTFECTPKIVLIQPNSNDYSYQSPYIVGSSYMHAINGSAVVANNVSVSGNTMSWYCQGSSNCNAKTQLNAAGVVYTYIAIR